MRDGSKNSRINLLQTNPLRIDRKLTYMLIISILILALLLIYFIFLRAQIAKFATDNPEPLLEADQEEQLRRELEEMSFWLDFSAAKKNLSASCLHQLLLAADDITGEHGWLYEMNYRPGKLSLRGQAEDIESYNNIIQRQAVWRSRGFEVLLERTSYFASPEFKLILQEVNSTGIN